MKILLWIDCMTKILCFYSSYIGHYSVFFFFFLSQAANVMLGAWCPKDTVIYSRCLRFFSYLATSVSRQTVNLFKSRERWNMDDWYKWRRIVAEFLSIFQQIFIEYTYIWSKRRIIFFELYKCETIFRGDENKNKDIIQFKN